MAFFDNWGEVISGKGKEAAQTAKRMAEIANLKGQISGYESEMKKNYRNIGKAYYEAYRDKDVTCEFEEYVQAIRDAEKAAGELQRKIDELKGERECSECGSKMKNGSVFCSNCGAKVEYEFFDEEDAEVIDESMPADEETFFYDVPAATVAEAVDEVEELEEVEETAETE